MAHGVGSVVPKAANARPAARSMIMPPWYGNPLPSAQMRSGRVGSGVLPVILNALTTLLSMSITRTSARWRDPENTPTRCGSAARDLCAATKVSSEMWARHTLHTHRNWHRAYASSLTSTSKMMSSGSEQPPLSP